MNPVLLIAIMLGATLIGAVGALFLKWGAAEFSLHPKRWLKQHHALIGGTLYLVSAAIYVVLLRYLPLSTAYPLTSLSYLWIMALSGKYLGERIDVWHWCGAALIVSGVLILFL